MSVSIVLAYHAHSLGPGIGVGTVTLHSLLHKEVSLGFEGLLEEITSIIRSHNSDGLGNAGDLVGTQFLARLPLTCEASVVVLSGMLVIHWLVVYLVVYLV
jgi:hypothetical protein